MAHNYPRPPFRFGGRVTDTYRSGHRARDVAPRNDDDGWVYAVEAGTVTEAVTGRNPGDDNPNLIAVKGTDGAVTIYGHVDPCPDIFRAIVGFPVRRGERIGRVDVSGQSSGRHVHLVRMPQGSGTLDDIENRAEAAGVFFTISLNAWPSGELR
jgi:murein DD-endopeptidase MepM/ murein hydrolase activator NlpD